MVGKKTDLIVTMNGGGRLFVNVTVNKFVFQKMIGGWGIEAVRQ